MATGTRDGVEQADDVDFARPRGAVPRSGCTDPYAAAPR